MIDPQKIHDTFRAYGGAVLSVLGGTWGWIGDNHQQIGIAFGLTGVIYATITFFRPRWYRRMQRKQKRQDGQ